MRVGMNRSKYSDRLDAGGGVDRIYPRTGSRSAGSRVIQLPPAKPQVCIYRIRIQFEE